MLCYQKVILYLLYNLSKIFGILDYRFDSKKIIFIKSRVGYCYILIWHWIFTTPFCLYYIFMWYLYASVEVDVYLLSTVESIYESQAFLHISFIVSWILIRNRKNLQDLLHLFFDIGNLHHKIFGSTLKVARIDFLLYTLRVMWLWYKIMPDESYGNISLIIQTIRLLLQSFLTDVAMLFHLQHLKSLESRLCIYPQATHTERLLYIDYTVELLKLRPKMQIFLWPTHLYRFNLELCTIAVYAVTLYWELQWNQVCYLILQELFFSSMIPILCMARRIYNLEVHIYNTIYDQELAESLRKPKIKRNLRLVKVRLHTCIIYIIFHLCLQLEQLHFKRCTIKERSITIFNSIFLRRGLVLEILDFVFTHALLVISLSVTYHLSENGANSELAIYH